MKGNLMQIYMVGVGNVLVKQKHLRYYTTKGESTTVWGDGGVMEHLLLDYSCFFTKCPSIHCCFLPNVLQGVSNKRIALGKYVWLEGK